MRGSIAATCITLAIAGVLLLGYFANVEDVRTQRTSYEYVTEISGAFDGSRGQLDIDYDPSSNITGWSTQQAYNSLYISGVQATYQDQANSYFVYKGAGANTMSISATLTADQTDGQGMTSATLAWSEDGQEKSATIETSAKTGIYNGEILTAVYADGVTYGGFGVTIEQLIGALGHTGTIRISIVSDKIDGFPGIFYGAQESISTQRVNVGYSEQIYVVDTWTGQGHDPTATYTSSTETVSGDSGGSAAASAYLFWGKAAYSKSSETANPAVSLMLYVSETPDTGYVSTADGVIPTSESTGYTIETVEHDSIGSMVTTFAWSDMSETEIGTWSESIPVYIRGSDGTVYTLGTLAAAFDDSANLSYSYTWTAADGSVTSFRGTGNYDGSTIKLAMSEGKISMTWGTDSTAWTATVGPTEYNAIWTDSSVVLEYMTIQTTYNGSTYTWGEISG